MDNNTIKVILDEEVVVGDMKIVVHLMDEGNAFWGIALWVTTPGCTLKSSVRGDGCVVYYDADIQPEMAIFRTLTPAGISWDWHNAPREFDVALNDIREMSKSLRKD